MSKTTGTNALEPASEHLSRQLGPRVNWFVYVFLILFALYHYITAGIGIPVDYWHMGIHLAGVLLIIFVLYPAFSGGVAKRRSGLLAPGGVPIQDWVLGITGAATALWIGFSWEGFRRVMPIKWDDDAVVDGRKSLNPRTGREEPHHDWLKDMGSYIMKVGPVRRFGPSRGYLGTRQSHCDKVVYQLLSLM